MHQKYGQRELYTQNNKVKAALVEDVANLNLFPPLLPFLVHSSIVTTLKHTLHLFAFLHFDSFPFFRCSFLNTPLALSTVSGRTSSSSFSFSFCIHLHLRLQSSPQPPIPPFSQPQEIYPSVRKEGRKLSQSSWTLRKC
jgi:hypothetical protein